MPSEVTTQGKPLQRSTSVLHVVAGEAYGGGSRVIYDLAVDAAAHGFQVTVATTEARLAGQLRAGGVQVLDSVVISRTLNPFRDGLALIKLIRHLRQKKYDVVHTHTSKGGLIGRVAAYTARVPMIVHTVHGFPFHEGTGRAAKLALVSLERTLARLSTVLVTVSNFHRDQAIALRIAQPGKVLAIPNGIQDLRVGPASFESEVLPQVQSGEAVRPFHIVCHGRLSAQKGIDFLLQAASEMPAHERRRLKVTLAGEGELLAELVEKADGLGLHDTVVFCGFRSDVAVLLGEADLVVLPSLWEGLSISLLEAFSMERAVVTTSISSNIEATEDGGCAVLVPAGESRALAVAISALMGSSERRLALARSARERYETTYTSRRMTEQYLEVYLGRRAA